MKPSITDQLTRTIQTLQQVTLPQVADPAARRVTESALAGLDLIARAWPRVLPFLVWDNTQMTRLLQDRDVATPSTPLDPLDVDAHERLNEDLRQRLEEFLSAGPGVPEPEILEHLDNRARRYPLRYVPTLNTGPGTKEQ